MTERAEQIAAREREIRDALSTWCWEDADAPTLTAGPMSQIAHFLATQEGGRGGADTTTAACRHAELPDTLWPRLRDTEAAAERRLALLRQVAGYDNANQSDLPLPLLDAIRAEVGDPR